MPGPRIGPLGTPPLWRPVPTHGARQKIKCGVRETKWGKVYLGFPFGGEAAGQRASQFHPQTPRVQELRQTQTQVHTHEGLAANECGYLANGCVLFVLESEPPLEVKLDPPESKVLFLNELLLGFRVCSVAI